MRTNVVDDSPTVPAIVHKSGMAGNELDDADDTDCRMHLVSVALDDEDNGEEVIEK